MLWKDVCWINNGRQPEPKLKRNVKKLPNITKKNIQHTQDHPQADRKQNLYRQNREDRKKNPAGEITADDKKNGEQPKNYRKVKSGI